MFSGLDKIVKKSKDQKPTDTEEEVAKGLLELEMKETEANVKSLLKGLVICEAKEIPIKATGEKALLIKVPFKALPILKKVHEKVISALEKKFSCTVVIVGQRTIISKHGTYKKFT